MANLPGAAGVVGALAEVSGADVDTGGLLVASALQGCAQ